MREIQLNKGFIALVDDEDYERISSHKWSVFNNGGYIYALRVTKDGSILMHREVMGTPDGTITHHIDHNGLNNCKVNLVLCVHRQNMQSRKLNTNNTSGYKGVWYRRDTHSWKAVLRVSGKQVCLGHYGTAYEASKAYDMGAIKYYGIYAMTNEMLQSL